MNDKQWVKLLKKDSPTSIQWKNAINSAGDWCSCAVGVLILGDKAIENPGEEFSDETYEKRKSVIKKLTPKTRELGYAFTNAICDKNLKLAREIWNEIHGDKK